MLPVAFHQLPTTLVMSGKHTTQHDKVGTTAKGLGNITGTGAASI